MTVPARAPVGAPASATTTMTEPVRRRRRRVVAPVGRIVTAGLSASAMFGLVAVMGATADASEDGVVVDPAVSPGPGSADPSGAPPPTTTRRKVYVIEHLPADAPLADGSAPGSDPAPGAAEIPDGAPATATSEQAPLGLARSRTRRS